MSCPSRIHLPPSKATKWCGIRSRHYHTWYLGSTHQEVPMKISLVRRHPHLTHQGQFQNSWYLCFTSISKKRTLLPKMQHSSHLNIDGEQKMLDLEKIDANRPWKPHCVSVCWQFTARGMVTNIGDPPQLMPQGAGCNSHPFLNHESDNHVTKRAGSQ